MNLQDQLVEDMKQAMRDRDVLKLSVVRYLRSDIQNAKIDQGELDDTAIYKLIAKQIKQMQEAAEQFAKNDRQDLADEETKKVAILQQYAPKQLSDEELGDIIDEVVAQTAEPSIKTVMPVVMTRVAGKADGRRVSQMLQAKL